MQTEIKRINLPLPFRMGSVNCYLLISDTGDILIDTGGTNNRKELVRVLENAGCKPGSLKLIVLTHGDFDHSGNAAYLRKVFGGEIAMHPGDVGMVHHGDMFDNRKKPPFIFRMLLTVLMGLRKRDRFNPDLFIKEGDDLNEYGLDARALSLPGHSKGSIAILTAEKDLFCGDLLENTKNPAPGSLIDDRPAFNASLQKLKNMEVRTIYPGHGAPFSMGQLSNAE